MRLLVVEDEDDLAQTLKTALEEGFAVDVAGDGDEGLVKVTETAYDSAIVDLMLPRRDGWSLISTAR